jgi:hypothetical protein
MKRKMYLALLMVACGLIGSANADTYQLSDYITTNPTFDDAVTGVTWADWKRLDYPCVDLETQQPGWTQWQQYGFTEDYCFRIVDMGTEAYSGTQALAMATAGTYPDLGYRILPNAQLRKGDTWEFDFALRGSALEPQTDVNVWISASGENWDVMTIAAASILNDQWTSFHYSGEYDGDAQGGVNPGGWAIRLEIDHPASGWTATYFDFAVPEPATLSVTCLGGILCLFRRKK